MAALCLTVIELVQLYNYAPAARYSRLNENCASSLQGNAPGLASLYSALNALNAYHLCSNLYVKVVLKLRRIYL